MLHLSPVTFWHQAHVVWPRPSLCFGPSAKSTELRERGVTMAPCAEQRRDEPERGGEREAELRSSGMQTDQRSEWALTWPRARAGRDAAKRPRIEDFRTCKAQTAVRDQRRR